MNAKDAWLKQVNHHKKKKKGLSPFCKLDAGNVELNQEIFNSHSSPAEGPNVNPNGPMAGEMASSGEGISGGCCESMITMQGYNNKPLGSETPTGGELLHFTPEISKNLAESSDRASLIRDLEAKGKKYRWNHYSDQQIYRIWKRVMDEQTKQIDTTIEAEFDDEYPTYEYCDNCGRRLTDINKECPFCDLGDESVLEEDFNPQEEIELEYDGIDVEGDWGPRSWEDGSYKYHREDTVSVTYTITKQDAIEVFQDDLWGTDECRDMSDEEFEEYLQENIDSLIERYMDKIMEYYYEYACQKAQDEYDPEEAEEDERASYYEDRWDDRYDESVNPYEGTSDFIEDDEFDMIIRGI